MVLRKIGDGVFFLPSIDWDRRLFDSLIPLPDGTTYNAYLIEGSEKTALLDTADLKMRDSFLSSLKEIKRIDYLIAHHGEQDHSGLIPDVLERYPETKLVVSSKGKEILLVHLPIDEERVKVVEDGETLDLGGKTLQFIYTPWVHWPETMVTYLQEENILFSCDFFGLHLATSETFVRGTYPLEAAKRYFAEIMMPFSPIIQKNLEKIKSLKISLIAPSHGPIWGDPDLIMERYRQWTGEKGENKVLIPFVSMHDSTRIMVDYLSDALIERGVQVERFELPHTDLGRIAMGLVEAPTLILGTPTVLAGAHPYAAFAAFLVNALRPRLRFVSLVGSYGWGGKTVEQISGLLGNLKVEILEPVLARGFPRESDFKALDRLADSVLESHRKEGII